MIYAEAKGQVISDLRHTYSTKSLVIDFIVKFTLLNTYKLLKIKVYLDFYIEKL